MIELATSSLQLLQISFLALLSLLILLRTALSNLSTHLPLSIFIFIFIAVSASFLLLHHLYTRPRPVYLLNYSCYKPPPHLKCPLQLGDSFIRQSRQFSPETHHFMRNIFLKSGLGSETYAPPFFFTPDQIPTLKCALQEAEHGIFSCIDSLLSKTLISPSRIDVVIVTSGSFSPSPSLSSLVVNRYRLKDDVKTFNLSGMGCSSGVSSIDLAARILYGSRKVRYALVVITESITLNWYRGEERSMLVTNCIFRVGCAAALVTNDPNCSRVAKMELIHSLRTHHGADDSAYHAAFQEEDGKGNTGISLTKDLIRVAGANLREHIRILAPRVLPMTQLVSYVYSVAVTSMFPRGDWKPMVPDFTTAFDHMCVHTGGKAVIEQVGRVLRLGEEVTEPARMCLHRFGNTSSSLVFYELAYFEGKKRVKKGDRMWMVAFGTGFKVGSLVWKWIRDSSQECDNPWNDCIDTYPVKTL